MVTPSVSQPTTHKPRIVALPHSGANEWRVLADWMGAVRTVYVGTIFECSRFIANMEKTP